MKRSRSTALPWFLAALVLGLTGCRRVSWQLVAEPLPDRGASAEAAPAQDADAPDEESREGPQADERATGWSGGAVDPASAGVLEGHVVGAPRVQVWDARSSDR